MKAKEVVWMGSVAIIVVLGLSSYFAVSSESGITDSPPPPDFSNPALILFRNGLQDLLFSSVLPVTSKVSVAGSASATDLTVVGWKFCGPRDKPSKGQFIGVAYKPPITFPAKGSLFPEKGCAASLSEIAKFAAREDGATDWVIALSIEANWDLSGLNMSVRDAEIGLKDSLSIPPVGLAKALKQQQHPVTLLALNTSQINLPIGNNMKGGLIGRFLKGGILLAIFPQPISAGTIIPESAYNFDTANFSTEPTTVARIPFSFINALSSNLGDKEVPISNSGFAVKEFSANALAGGFRFRARIVPTPADSIIAVGMDFSDGSSDLKFSDVKIVDSQQKSADPNTFGIQFQLASVVASKFKTDWHGKLLRPETAQQLGIADVGNRRFAMSAIVAKAQTSSTDLLLSGYGSMTEVK